MNTFKFILLFILSSSYAKAQTIFSKCALYFESGKYVITKDQKHQLDSFIVSLTNIPSAFEIAVKGHTDNKGSLELNETLSKNRSTEILNYLIKKGFKTTDSSLAYFAFNKPAIENTEDNLWKNRRVEIVVYQRRFKMVQLLGITDFVPEKYSLNEDEGGVLKYDSTTITIAPNSFVNADGSEVTGNITIAYTEYRNPTDFLLSDIPMSTGSGNNMQNFESGGMFKILANQNGKKLVLKQADEKNILIEMPLKKTPNQKFYQFDSLDHHWIDSQREVTDSKGKMIDPRVNRLVRLDDPNSGKISSYIYPNCITGDTCKYFDHMFLKLNYYLTHQEPLLPGNPYKSVKNNVVDYKSPLYNMVRDTVKGTFRFESMNSYNELGKFSNYEWKSDEISSGYYSFIKIIYLGDSKFQIKTNKGSQGQIYTVTGKSTSFHLFGNQAKINSKNNKKYLKELYDFDNTEIENDKILKNKLEITDINEFLFSDSLTCFTDFYTHFLCDSSESAIIKKEGGFYNYFIKNKEKILSSFNRKKAFFSCEKYKKDVGKLSEEKKIRISTMAKFGIRSLGAFNADAIKRISDPEVITPVYKLKGAEKELSIITVFISMTSLNGLMRYDGHYGYGPYKFVYGKNDTCNLIAVDNELNTYVVSRENFKKAVSHKIDNKVVFILKEMKDLKSKENLYNIMMN